MYEIISTNTGKYKTLWEKQILLKKGQLMNIKENVYICIYKKWYQLIEEQKSEERNTVNLNFTFLN
jgi:hypothetical protein